MAEYYLLALVLLFVLAVLDLSVGVSNDAVNFLNSAVGSRVATRRTILVVASAGILCGALFSSGMMEVARKGIFNPELFTFANVMVIFLAVMLADVILLDLFNTLGLPTSTTVSIVFELLGAATAVAVLVVMTVPEATSITPFINVASALAIVAGIVLSVGVAFAVGTAVQFVSRLLFSFDGRRHGPLLVQAWSALALAVITDFLFVKGLKGASFVPAGVAELLGSRPLLAIAGLFAGWFVVLGTIRRLGIAPLRLVVLAGTFALAMAFASNDLVNFIGVPLAGLASWRSWQASGGAADTLTMEALAAPVRGDTLWLAGAGLVMIATLWLSAKARTVTETEVNLGRQDDGAERFRPGPVSRGVVGAVQAVARFVPRLVPAPIRTRIGSRFLREAVAPAADAPAFDLVRASVNLTVAAALIALATAMKLPLSTTYVSFMVAMGTSLADRAWGRDSAVYRVSGVLTVIAGWFATALIAFATAAIFALLIAAFEAAGLLLLTVLAAVALVHSHRRHARGVRSAAERIELEGLTGEQAVARAADRLDAQLLRLDEAVGTALLALAEVDRRRLGQAGAALGQLAGQAEAAERSLVTAMRRAGLADSAAAPRLLVLFDAERDLLDAARTIVDTVDRFVRNGHTAPAPAVRDALTLARARLGAVLPKLRAAVTGSPADPGPALRALRDQVDRLQALQLDDLASTTRSDRNGAMQLTVTLELLDLAAALERLAPPPAQRRLHAA